MATKRFYESDEKELEQKKAFAMALIRFNGDASKAGFCIEQDTGKALQIGFTWSHDEFVKAEMERVFGSAEAKKFLPTKEQQAKDVYSMAVDIKLSTDDRIKAHRLYAEIMQHIEKPKEATTVTVAVQNVMAVPFAKSEEEWENFAVRQQHQLTEASSVN